MHRRVGVQVITETERDDAPMGPLEPDVPESPKNDEVPTE